MGPNLRYTAVSHLILLVLAVRCASGLVFTACSAVLSRRYATILAFDVKVTHDAQAEADKVGVRIFTADIIYHLTDQFEKFMADVHKAAQEASQTEAMFPCICRIIPTAVFNAKNPLVLGMDVVEGSLRIGTTVCVLRGEGDSKPAEACSRGLACVRRHVLLTCSCDCRRARAIPRPKCLCLGASLRWSEVRANQCQLLSRASQVWL
jgi:hypothetical protein